MAKSKESEHTSYLCIGCPLGCRLEVEHTGEDVVEVRGAGCKRGDKYAREEHTRPVRMVTTTVTIRNGLWARLPVKTSAAIPKGRMHELCEVLQSVVVEAPVTLGDVVLENALGVGVDVVATRSMPRG